MNEEKSNAQRGVFFVAFSPSGNGGTGVGGGAQEGRFEVVAHVAAHVPARPVLVSQAIDRSFQQINTTPNSLILPPYLKHQ